MDLAVVARHQRDLLRARCRSALRRVDSFRRALPDFLILGTQKGGTTSLWWALKGHPWIVPPLIKEIDHFNAPKLRSASWYKSFFPKKSELLRRPGPEAPRRLTGEATTHYIFSRLAPTRARALLPEARFICLLRNPIDRALSQFEMDRRFDHPAQRGLDFAGVVGGAAPEEFPDLKTARGDASALNHLDRGKYAEQLERWFKLYPRDRFLVLKSEEFFADMKAGVRSACSHLGIPFWYPEDLKPVNCFDYPPCDPALRRRLADYFRPHNERLYRLLGVDYGWE